MQVNVAGFAARRKHKTSDVFSEPIAPVIAVSSKIVSESIHSSPFENIMGLQNVTADLTQRCCQSQLMESSIGHDGVAENNIHASVYMSDEHAVASGLDISTSLEQGLLSSENTETSDDPHKLYCVCRRPYSSASFMIQCDECNEWYHGECVSVTEYVRSSEMLSCILHALETYIYI